MLYEWLLNLTAVPIPGDSSLRNASEYYHHVADLMAGYAQHATVIHFGQLAILSGIHTGHSPRSLWTTVFLAYIALEQYEEAYALLTKTPFLDL